MKRNVSALTEKTYDVLIIGGGIYGLFTALDSARRGLSVALVERGDFGNATSSKTLRVIHGGLRYLQHADVLRMRASISERTTLSRIAPHLVHPMPFLIPTYGNGIKGKAALFAAVKAHDLVGFDRNRGRDSQKRMPSSWTLSKDECLSLFPGMQAQGLTGAVVYFDCQVRSSERLVVSVLRSAIDAGAEPANYVEVEGFINQGNRVIGVRARDNISGGDLEIKATVIVNAAGPWVDGVLGLLNGGSPRRSKISMSKAFNLVINRKLTEKYAFGFYSKSKFTDSDALLNKGSRMFFVTPWHDGSLIGTEHLPYNGEPDGFELSETEIQEFIDDINEAYPPLNIKRDDVCMTYEGLLPASGSSSTQVQLAKNYKVIDHSKEDNVDGLLSVMGVKFTESRHVARKATDQVFRKLGKTPPRCVTSKAPLHGGHIEQFDEFTSKAVAGRPEGIEAKDVRYLTSRYGSAYNEVMDCLNDPNGPSDDSANGLLKAEIVHGIRREMAQTLSDVVFRRTTLGMYGLPDDSTLDHCADIVAKELGWSESRKARELEEIKTKSRPGLLPVEA